MSPGCSRIANSPNISATSPSPKSSGSLSTRLDGTGGISSLWINSSRPRNCAVTVVIFYSSCLSRFVSGLALNAIPGTRETVTHRQSFFLQGDTCELPGRTHGKSTPTRYEQSLDARRRNLQLQREAFSLRGCQGVLKISSIDCSGCASA